MVSRVAATQTICELIALLQSQEFVFVDEQIFHLAQVQETVVDEW